MSAAPQEPGFYVTGGTLPSDAPSYVERRADRDLLHALRRGLFCAVLTARQMGKSSLMVRTATKLRAEGVAVAIVDLTALGQQVTPEQWYGGLLRRIGRQLDPEGPLEDALDGFWQEQVEHEPPARFLQALRRVVMEGVQVFGCSGVQGDSLPEHLNTRTGVPGPPPVRGSGEHPPIVIFLDEIDVVRSLPIAADGLFAAIRECHDRWSGSPRPAPAGELTFCVLGAATPEELIRDPEATPFHLGRRIELTDFTGPEAQPLARGIAGRGLRIADCQAVLRRILYWTAGHPYLTQRLCQAVSDCGMRFADPGMDNPQSATRNPQSVDRLVQTLFLAPEVRETEEHLAAVRERVLREGPLRAALLDLYGQVRAGQRVADDDEDPLIGVLKVTGLAGAAGGRLRVRNRIYERVFDRTWLESHLPAARRARQWRNTRRGLLAGAAAALVLVLWLGGRRNGSGPATSAVATLGDGTVIRLEGVSYGKEHVPPFGPVRPWWQFWRSSRSEAFLTENDALIFWLTHRPSAGSQRTLPLDWWRDFVVFDEHGCRMVSDATRSQSTISDGGSSMSGASVGQLLPVPPAGALRIWGSGVLSRFPRRGKTVRLRLIGPSGQPPVDLVLPNPVAGNYPVWQPERLPAVRRQDDLAFELLGVQAFLQSGSINQVKQEWPGLQPRFRVMEKGRESAGWEALQVTVLDATGNQATPYQCELCPLESAWKLRVTFHRTAGARFPPADTWTIPGIPVPGIGAALPLLHSKTLQGATIELLGIAGPGKYDYSNHVPRPLPLSAGERRRARVRELGISSSGGTQTINGRQVETSQVTAFLPQVAMKVQGLPAGTHWIVRATDGSGRTFLNQSSSSAGDFEVRTLNIPADLKRVSITIAIDRPRTVEYLIRPPNVANLQQIHRLEEKITALEAAKRYTEALPVLERAIALAPDNFHLLARRGATYGALGRWAEAEGDLRHATAVDPNSPGLLSQLAHLALRRGDRAGYCKWCAALIAPGALENEANLRAWPCVLAPGAVPNASIPVRLAEAAVSQGPDPGALNTLGAALYRAGRHKDAVRRLNEAIALQGKGGSVYDWLFLALAHQRLGHGGEARRWLNRAEPCLQRSPPGGWEGQIETKLLLSEAKRLIR